MQESVGDDKEADDGKGKTSSTAPPEMKRCEFENRFRIQPDALWRSQFNDGVYEKLKYDESTGAWDFGIEEMTPFVMSRALQDSHDQNASKRDEAWDQRKWQSCMLD